MNSAHPGLVCPACHVALVMSERQGVEIDYCPQCRGVWLDRGELDKIIERGSKEMAAYQQPSPQPRQPQYPQGQQQGYDQSHSHGYPKRKKSFFEELFD
ncbi:MAG: hypothetical protein JWM58_891 [Rhizobium sp.]|nr:hypothetical protein [Rhizobium sp.]